MSWTTLLLAGVFEVAWAVGLEYSEGFSRLWPSVGTLLALAVSMLLLGRAVQDLPVGTAYAVWTGVGAVGTAVLGVVLFDEPRSPGRLFFLGVVVVGVVGLRLTS